MLTFGPTRSGVRIGSKEEWLEARLKRIWKNRKNWNHVEANRPESKVEPVQVGKLPLLSINRIA